MGDLVLLGKHRLFRCEPEQDQCMEGRCMFCDGGLAMCTVCHGAEGTLPTDCPGVPMTGEQEQAVWRQEMDFHRRHGWLHGTFVRSGRA